MSNPPRRWIRPTTIVLALLAPLLGFALYVVYKSSLPPGVPGKFAAALDAHVLKGQPGEGSNGWDLLAALNSKRESVETSLWGDAERRKEQGRELDYSVLTAWPEPGLDAPRRAALEARKRDALATIAALSAQQFDRDLDALAACRRAFRPAPTGPMIAFELPECARTRTTARMLAAKMRLAAQSGDLVARARTFEQLLAMGRVIGRQATAIERLIGYAVTALALQRLNEDLIEYPPADGETGAAAIEELLAIMNRQIAFTPVADSLEGERFLILDTIEWSFSDDGAGDGWLSPDALARLQAFQGGAPQLTPGPRWMNFAGVFFPGKKSYIDMTDEMFRRLEARAALSREARRAGPTIDDWVKNDLGYRYALLSILMPAFDKIIQSDEQIRAEVEATRLILAVESHRRRTGKLPESLQALADARHMTLPADPINGKGFGYRILHADDPRGLGRGYLLYSLGDDAEDNHGAEAPEGPAAQSRYDALAPGKAPGSDFVFNHSERPTSK